MSRVTYALLLLHSGDTVDTASSEANSSEIPLGPFDFSNDDNESTGAETEMQESPRNG